MLDQHWIRHLSGARFVGERWETDDPALVDHLTTQRISQIIDQLSIDAKDAAQAYNHYLKSGHRLSVVSSHQALLLLMGHYQLQIRRSKHSLQVVLIRTKAFQAQQCFSQDLVAVCDPFGDVRWALGEGVSLDNKQIIMHCLKLLRQANEHA